MLRNTFNVGNRVNFWQILITLILFSCAYKKKKRGYQDLHLKSECAFFPFPYIFFLISGSVRKALRILNSSPLHLKYCLYFFFFLLVANLLQTCVYSSPTQELELPDGYRNVDCGEKSFSWEHGSLPFSSKDAGGKDQLIENLEIKKTK